MVKRFIASFMQTFFVSLFYLMCMLICIVFAVQILVAAQLHHSYIQLIIFEEPFFTGISLGP